jgi:hypothetical protein
LILVERGICIDGRVIVFLMGTVIKEAHKFQEILLFLKNSRIGFSFFLLLLLSQNHESSI